MVRTAILSLWALFQYLLLSKPNNGIFSIPSTPSSIPDLFVSGDLLKLISTREQVEALLAQSAEWKELLRTAIVQIDARIFFIPFIQVVLGVLYYIAQAHVFLSGASLYRRDGLDETEPDPLCKHSSILFVQVPFLICIDFILVIDMRDNASGSIISLSTGTIEDPAPGIVNVVCKLC